MKRFLRYLLLVWCLAVLALWVWSKNSWDAFGYTKRDWFHGSMTLYHGTLRIEYFTTNNLPYEGLEFRHWNPRDFSSIPEINPPHHYLGIIYHRNAYRNVRFYSNVKWDLSLSVIFAFNSGLLLLAWYHPLKDRWRGKDLRGFEVEMKDSNNREKA